MTTDELRARLDEIDRRASYMQGSNRSALTHALELRSMLDALEADLEDVEPPVDPPVDPPDPPDTGVQPDVSEDFSVYASTAEFLSSTHGNMNRVKARLKAAFLKPGNPTPSIETPFPHHYLLKSAEHTANSGTGA